MSRLIQKISYKVRSLSTHVGQISDCIALRDGYQMPLLGLGCYKLSPEVTEEAVLTALRCGYRLIDTAQSYKNESFVGSSIKKSGIPRNELFVVTKLSDRNGYKEARTSCLESLKSLNLDYIDLYLIHSPTSGRVIETWEAFTELQNEGYIRSIGVSNFNIHQLEPLRQQGFPLPVVNQIEHHPWYQKTELLEYCIKSGIAIMGYCPLARNICFDNYTPIDDLAEKYNKTKCQILLRWAFQKNIVTIPKSCKENRIRENANIYDFYLSGKEMEMISHLNENRKVSTVTALSDPWLG